MFFRIRLTMIQVSVFNLKVFYKKYQVFEKILKIIYSVEKSLIIFFREILKAYLTTILKNISNN